MRKTYGKNGRLDENWKKAWCKDNYNNDNRYISMIIVRVRVTTIVTTILLV